MSDFKLLIDTNVVIGLEDDHKVERSFARFHQKCSEYGVRVFVHGAAYDDVRRDKDTHRRRITLSKLAKFERLRGHPAGTSVELSGRFRAGQQRERSVRRAASEFY